MTSVQVPIGHQLQLSPMRPTPASITFAVLNPELKRDMTPRGEAYNVRVPAGKGKQLASLLKRIPA